jgi:hypothetical protein
VSYTYIKKDWKARIRQYAHRVILTPTGTTNEYDLVRIEGSITQSGTPLSPINLNSHEDAIEFAVDAANLITDATNLIKRELSIKSLGGI